MTELKELLAKINSNPGCITEIDWKKETQNFAVSRMCNIVIGIDCESTYYIVKECIANCWYDMTSCYEWQHGKLSIKDRWTAFGIEVFDTIPQEIPHEQNGRAIEDVLDNFRKKTAIQRQSRKVIEERKKRLQSKTTPPTPTNDSHDCMGLQAEMQRLQERLEKQQEINRTLEDRCDALTAEIKKYKLLQEEKPKEKIFREADPQKAADRESADVINIRKFLESIIEYAENFPSNQNDKADVIKGMLMAKGFNGQIPNEALTSEMRARIVNLGRKETPMPAMFNVTGNEEVNIGAK